MKRTSLHLAVVFHVLVLSTTLNAQTFEWAKATLGTGFNGVNAIALDPSGNVYITGYFRDTIDLDPGPDTLSVISAGLKDVFIQKLDPSGNLMWATKLGDSGNDLGQGITTDALGNVYIIGSFYGTVDFDPGVGSYNLSSTGSSDIFVQKLDASGNLIWAKSMGGLSGDAGEAITVDDVGNVYITGSFNSTADFDPGAGIYNLSDLGYGYIFVEKLDASGNFVWAKGFGGQGNNYGRSIMLDGAGNVYTMGNFWESGDFDPGPGFYNIAGGGMDDIFIQKLDTSGNFIWARAMGGASYDYGFSSVLDRLGNVYTTGRFDETADFDPGTGTFNLTSAGLGDIFIQKLDADGNLVWAKSIGGVNYDYSYSIALNSFGSIYTTGYFTGTVDFDPGVGVFNLTSIGTADFYILKLDVLGNLIWVRTLTDSASGPFGESLTIGPLGDIYTTGIFKGTVDFDMDTGIFNLTGLSQYDVFVTKWKRDTCYDLVLVIENAVDVGCLNPGFASAYALNGLPPYSYSWNTSPITTDSFAIFSGNGVYELSLTDSRGCERNTSVVINQPGSMTNYDLHVNLVTTFFRSGFPAEIWLDAFNDGCVSISGQLSIVLDELVSYDSASLAPDLIQGDTLIWNFVNLTYDSAHLMSQIFLTTDSSANFGDSVCFEVLISPVIGDLDTSNNIKRYCDLIINAFDPNEKQVHPEGGCDAGYIINDQLLTYTIHFQNMGNAEAINIYLLDTLDTNLDINTLRVIGKNHEPLITEVLSGNVIRFRFDSIMLPDSSSNEPESHGYVIFEIQPFLALPNGTALENKAGIYFDFNEPVVTNVVINTIIDNIPDSCTMVSDIADKYTLQSNIIIFPNPTSQSITIELGETYGDVVIRVTNVLGQEIEQKAFGTANTINLKIEAPSGMYFISIKNGNEQITFIKVLKE